MEVAIPFKSLRYRGSGPQTWGINLRRLVKWKNEFSYLSLVPAALGTGGVSRMASAATVVGLETPAQSKNLELKPYACRRRPPTAPPRCRSTNDRQANAGLDFKYGLTRSLIVDATYRTDFAQVEEDLQQINLTRFSLFFPEKRDFFIEGQGIFDFGGVQAGNSPGDVPLLFFSRQIGLSQGQAVPVVGGVRLTGRAGPFSIGALNIQTEDAPSARAVATNFSALRLKRNLLQAQQRRRDGDPPRAGARRGVRSRSRGQLHLRRRCHDAVLQEHQHHELLRAHQRARRARSQRRRHELSRAIRLQRRSLRRRRSTC